MQPYCNKPVKKLASLEVSSAALLLLCLAHAEMKLLHEIDAGRMLDHHS